MDAKSENFFLSYSPESTKYKKLSPMEQMWPAHEVATPSASLKSVQLSSQYC
jgi:hypothetical protein